MREYHVVLNNAKLPFAFISVLLKIDLIHNYKQIFAICTDTINSINARSRLIYYGVKVRVGLKCTALYNKKPGDLFFFWRFGHVLYPSCSQQTFYGVLSSQFVSFFFLFLFFFFFFFYCNLMRTLQLFVGQSIWFLQRKFDVVLHTAELFTPFPSSLP